MKKICLYITLLIGFNACEDVVDVDLPTEEPRLIVDAVIRIDTSNDIQMATVKINLTNSFFENITPLSLDDLDTLVLANLDFTPTASDPNIINFREVNPGVFEGFNGSDFFTSGRLVLGIVYQGQTYLSQTSFVEAAPIDNLEQGDGTLFDEDDTEVIITFTDNANQEDFYIFDFDFDEFLVSPDIFYEDQQFEFSYFYDKNLQPGQRVEISILGADRSFFNYMGQVIDQSDGNLGPFGVPAATVRGNIANVTGIDIGDIEDVTNLNTIDLFNTIAALNSEENLNNFALGYFAVVEEFSETLIIE
ncbi:DUF4249 family protein [Spongiimicrobium salis]|uniref:DUF4249 family protein n=1 Tax=Spongiimicrobium salis TaxID=1667022 RepID=UPI00374D48AA